MYILEIILRNGVTLRAETESKPKIDVGQLQTIIGISWEGTEPQAELYLQYINYADVSAVLITNTMPDYEFTVDYVGEKIPFSKELVRAVNSNSDKVTAIKELRNRTSLGLKQAKDVIEMLVMRGVLREALKGTHLTEDNPAFIVGQ